MRRIDRLFPGDARAFMKRVYSSPDSAQVGLFRGILEISEIPCEIRNEAVSQVIPGLAFSSELWVLRDEDYDEARKLIAAPESEDRKSTDP